jgi:D-sedoheptulose 7-phosphate isomerase
MDDPKIYMQTYVKVLNFLDVGMIERMSDILVGAWRCRRTVYVCGNGGSAANASHFAADLTKLTAPPTGPRLRAVSLTESLSAISAIGNDLAYGEIFAEQLRASLDEGDVVMGFSTSGSSPNVLRAIEYANDAGGITLGVTGQGGHALKDRAQLTLVVPSDSVQHVEDATMVAAHILCIRVAAHLRREWEATSTAKVPAARPLLVRAVGS